jgi:hypothetical protein
MNKHHVLKHSFGVLSALALSLAIWIPQSAAQLPPGNQDQSSQFYACAPGAGKVHDVSDLTGGDLPQHQTGGMPKLTCYAASKPSGSDAHYSCATGALRLVSELKGGVLAEHQVGNPPRTCIQGNLPICAPGYIPYNAAAPVRIPSNLAPGGICISNPK